MSQRFYVETLGCPKNQVDSDKLVGTLLADGMEATDDASAADLVVVNTCAFIDDARRESVDTILALDEQRADGARLVVTGCMAERYGDELAEALPEVDQVAGFGVPVNDRSRGRQLIPVASAPLPELDLLNLPATEVDRRRGPTSRSPRGATARVGSARSRASAARSAAATSSRSSTEVDELEAREIVLVAQDLASYGKDRPDELGAGSIVPLVRAVADRTDWVRLLYLYPSDLTDELIDAICATGCSVLRPVAPTRQQAAAAADASVGRRRPVPPPDRRHPQDANPMPRSGRTSSSGTRARPSATTISCSRSSRPRSSTGAASSPTRPRTARTPRPSTVPSTPD